MKVFQKYILLVFACPLLLTACQKEDIPVYTDAERVNFDYSKMKLTRDTVDVVYGFVTDQFREIHLELLLMGYPKEHEREVNLTITSEDGAIAGTHYEIPDKIVIPAGEVSVAVLLNVLRPTELLEKSCSFLVKLEDSKELLAGLRTTLLVTVSDDLPDKWEGDAGWMMNKISDYFGECSKTKYLFVYEQLGIWDFKSWNVMGFMGDAAKFNPAKRILKEKLAEHEKENGPLVDPEKGQVTFPD